VCVGFVRLTAVAYIIDNGPLENYCSNKVNEYEAVSCQC
jgi:hypothetical protein